uniref:Uncharacterized protein n=1 Tax=Riptortus pedestris TaxID=329032 RepID=R4WIT9_RIPPE|nr:unknown secreted protein [Riptortus pedestris]
MSYWVLLVVHIVAWKAAASEGEQYYLEENGKRVCTNQLDIGDSSSPVTSCSPSQDESAQRGIPSCKEGVFKLIQEFRDLFSPGRDFLQLPRIENISNSGRFVATGGYVANLSTLQPKGKIIVTPKGPEAAELILPLEFEEFEAGYRTYSVVLSEASHTGSIKITADQPKIKMVVNAMLVNGECNNISVRIAPDIEGLSVNLEGAFEHHDDIKKLLTDWVAESFIQNFKDFVANEIQERFNSFL